MFLRQEHLKLPEVESKLIFLIRGDPPNPRLYLVPASPGQDILGEFKAGFVEQKLKRCSPDVCHVEVMARRDASAAQYPQVADLLSWCNICVFGPLGSLLGLAISFA